MKLKQIYKLKMALLCSSIVLIVINGCKIVTSEQEELNQKIKMAEKAASESNYKTAVNEYIETIILAEDTDPEMVYKLKKNLSRIYTEWARQLYWKAKTEKSPKLLEKAIFLCEKSIETNPKLQIKCKAYISKFKEDLSAMKNKSETALKNKLLPGITEKNYKSRILSKQGKALCKNEQYMKALEKFEEVLTLDPYNIDARRQVHDIKKKIEEIKKEPKKTDEKVKIPKVKLEKVKTEKVKSVAAREEAMEIASREVQETYELRNKMSNCEIKKIDFKDIPLEKAFNELHKMISTEINTEFKFEFKNFSPSDKNFQSVTFQAKAVPADTAIEALCDGFNLYPTFSKNLVIIEKKAE